MISEEVGNEVAVLDSAVATAERLAQVLADQSMLEASGTTHHKFLVTDDSASFQEACDRFFGAPVGHVEHVDL